MNKKIILSSAVALGIAASVMTVSAAYTNQPSKKAESAAPQASSKIHISTEETPDLKILNSKKQEIFNSILNSVDHFNTVSGEFETTLITGAPLTVCYDVDIPKQLSSQKILGSQINTEVFYKDDRILEADNLKKSCFETGFMSQLNSAERAALTPAANVAASTASGKGEASRVQKNQNGEMEFYYRANITNAGYAATSIFPQELCFGFLTELENWEVTGVETVLNRLAIAIHGKTADKSYAQKLQTDSFSMKIDYKTGILLDFKGCSESGKVTQSLTTTTISLDRPSSDLSNQIEKKMQAVEKTFKMESR